MHERFERRTELINKRAVIDTQAQNYNCRENSKKRTLGTVALRLICSFFSFIFK